MSIADSCMTCNLGIGMWEGRRLDKAIGKRITDEAHAQADAVRVNKLLVPKESFAKVTTERNALRQHFLDRTLPWKDNGDRLLTRKMFQRFMEEHAEIKSRFDDAVDDFVRVGYIAAMAQAEFRMGELFSEREYPKAGDLRQRFYVRLDIDSVTGADDFRVNISAEATAMVKQNLEDAMHTRIQKAQADVWSRMAELVERFADRMSGEDNLFRDSIVGNLTDLLDVLPGLNILGDQDMKRIAADVRQSLAVHDPKELRKNKALRADAASEAKRIMADMSGFMNAFKGAAE